MSSTDHLGGYPSPGPAPSISNLPFYQYPPDQQRQLELQQNGPEQDGGASETSDGGDVPQSDAHLASMMGSFGGFAPLMHHQQSNASSFSPITDGSLNFAQPSGSPDSAPPTQDASSKQGRVKVSRACDECRRKKIRCDAPDETGDPPCSCCVRTGSKCAFSRQPMKRGPSKGYIKELAERLNTLERQVHPGQSPQPDGQREGAFSPSVEPRAGYKRTYAVAEGLQNENHVRPESSTNPTRGQTEAFQQALPPTASPQDHQQSGGLQPFWRAGANDNRQDTTALSYEAEDNPAINVFDWDDAVLDEYYRIIHQTFPLLPNNKNRLRQRLAECPSSLRDGFLTALDCTMRTWPTTILKPNPNYAQALKKAAEMLAMYPFDKPSSHTNATNLVYLQTLLLMAIQADNHGPATIRGQAGPSRAEWLGRAAGVAGQLEINVIRTPHQSIVGGDRDSEERLARRVWWCLFILDRWHASSTADLLKLPENSVVLLPEDQILLGESTYHLARLSFIIGHLAAILTTTKTPSTDVMAPLNPASALLGLTLAGEIDRFRESVESVWGSLNLVHLSYHHCHLLIKRLNPSTEPPDLVSHAVKVATVLNSRLTPLTPLNHHFGALAAMTLCELCDISKTRKEALLGLDHLAEALGAGRGLAGKHESEGWDGAIRELVVRKRERMQRGSSLDALADAAGWGAAGGEGEAFSPPKLLQYGYLTALGQGVFPVK